MRSQLSILKYAALWVVMLALGLGLPTRAAAIPYSFTLIADSSGPFNFTSYVSPGNDGIFTGPDPVAHEVLETGDLLFGDTVRFVDIFTEGLNDAGQIAFYFELDNGIRGMARADPEPQQAVPEPSTLPLLGVALGALVLAVRRKVSSLGSLRS